MEQEVIFNGQILTLTRFWATGEPCLWITDPEQIGMPKMEFVGGHPDEYCIFLKNLTETAGTDHISGRCSTGCKRRTKRHRMRRTL